MPSDCSEWLRVRLDNICCYEFEWSAYSKDLHVALVAIIRIVAGTACAGLHDIVDISGHMRPVDLLSEYVVNTTLARMAYIR